VLRLGRRRGSRADAAVGIASLNRTERDRAEGKTPQLRVAWTARLACLARLAATRGWLDGQDRQLSVG